MKTKIEYKELKYDFWNLSELKEIFEKGELYYHSRDCFFKFETLLDVGTGASMGDTIYKRVETELTLLDEISELAEDGTYFELSREPVGEGWLSVCSGGYVKAEFKFETIHKLSEILKQHGK